MVSVIVPVYNSSRYLARCIDSILNQSYDDFELLLINDGSIDDSGTICEKYKLRDKRVKVYHQTNKGVSAARNHGLCVSSGEWITFIDSDDYLKPDYLSNFNSSSLAKSDLAIQGITTIDQFGKIINKLQYLDFNIDLHLGGNNAEVIDKYQLFQNRGPYAKLYNRSIIQDNDIRFEEDISIAEDGIFFYSYLRYVHRLVVTSYLGYNYVKYGSNTLSQKPHSCEEWEKVYTMYYSLSQELYGRLNMLDSQSYRCKLHDIVTYRTTGVFLQMYKQGYPRPQRMGIIHKMMQERYNMWPPENHNNEGKISFYAFLFKTIPYACIIDFIMKLLKYLHLY